MQIKIKEIYVKDYVTKSNLPFCDYTINPYIGCPHACKYCYASFIKRFTEHKEPWGSFLDVKFCEKPIDAKKITGKSVSLSSVTDAYNIFETKYKLTREILKQLAGTDCNLCIATKSNLILRDIDLLKKQKNVTVAISLNTLDENFRKDMDNASSVCDRLNALRELHDNKIHTVLFMSPIFPEITDFKAIINTSRDFVDEYWFENLNLRGDYKQVILAYIHKKYSRLFNLYCDIYQKHDAEYWLSLEQKIIEYCEKKNIKYLNVFYHSKLVHEKKIKKDTRFEQIKIKLS